MFKVGSDITVFPIHSTELSSTADERFNAVNLPLSDSLDTRNKEVVDSAKSLLCNSSIIKYLTTVQLKSIQKLYLASKLHKRKHTSRG